MNSNCFRKQTVEFEGASVVIAELSFGQIEAFIEANHKAVETKDQTAIVATWADLVCTSLNNAGANPAWKPEDVKQNIGARFIGPLRDAILEFSGMGAPKEPKEKAGEAAAS